MYLVNGGDGKQTPKHLDLPKNSKSNKAAKKEVSRSEQSSPKRSEIIKDTSQTKKSRITKAMSKSLPSSPRGELNEEVIDDYENIEETLQVYTAADGKISGFWTLPTQRIKKNRDKVIEVLYKLALKEVIQHI